MEPRSARDYSSSVDTSRPFRSVKEAVAIFGERILVGEIYSPKPFIYTPPKETTPWMAFSSPSPNYKTPHNEEEEQYQQNNNGALVFDTLKKLEAELEETKAELKSLKERESETEIALASLNAELHKNMSKLAEAEAAAAKRAAAAAAREKKEDVLIREGERRRELMMRVENSPTLAQILSLSEERGYLGSGNDYKKKKRMKKKPIVPLVGDLFFKKRGSSSTLDNPLYASPHVFFN